MTHKEPDLGENIRFTLQANGFEVREAVPMESSWCGTDESSKGN